MLLQAHPGRARYAAGEFDRYASKMLGSKVSVLDAVEPLREGPVIVIGRPNPRSPLATDLEASGALPSCLGLGEEGFIIRSLHLHGGPSLLIAGRTDLGTLYGVYHYLEHCCKVGFFWSADQIPRLKRIPIEGLELVENPRFAERFMTGPGGYSFVEYWTWKDWKREIEYRVRKKLNLISLYLGSDIVWGEVLSSHGMESKPPTGADIYKDRLAQKVFRHARKLGLRTITPAFMGDVPAEFARANPDVRYVKMKKWDLTSPKRKHIYPSDPMFRTLGEEFLKAYAARYGTDHYYFVPPYPEAIAGSTGEEIRNIKLDFARAVQDYMEAADPDWRWLADSWTFFTQEFWPLDQVRSFCQATDKERFTIYDTWGEERPLYKINNYYYDRCWSLGILHTFGGNTTLRGDLQGLIDSVDSVCHDPRAGRCVGIYLVPEVIHHNDLYYDLIMELMWNPRGVPLDGFIEDYALRRYGRLGALTMARALSLLAQSVYSDKDLTQPLFLRKLYGGFDTPNTEHYIPPVHARYVSDVGEALSLALEESRSQRSNRLYWRDLVDMARRYVGDVFNQLISKAYYAFDSGDVEEFESYRAGIGRCMDAIEGVLWSWDAYSLESITRGMRLIRGFDSDRERSTRDMLSLWESENLLDYVRRDDLAELFTHYYRRRVEAYLVHLADRLGPRQPGIDRDFLESAYREAGRQWIDGPRRHPQVRSKRDPIGAVRRSLEILRTSADRLFPHVRGGLENPGFWNGLIGWHVSRSRLDVRLEKDGGPDGTPVLLFSGREPEIMKYMTVWQDLRARDDLQFELDWRLDAFGPSSRAGLRLEIFKKELDKTAQLTYQFGDGKDFWPDRQQPDDATPDWRIGVDARLEWWTGFYVVKHRLGADLHSWRHLSASPAADLDETHGRGTWKALEPALVRVSLMASSRLAEDPIVGAFSNLKAL